MSDPTPPPTPPSPPPPPKQGGSSVVISEELKQKHPDLIALIVASESMNDEERQYWVNILPIMTPEQLQNLRDILDNEKKQLAAIDEKYSKEIERIGETQLVKQTEEERRKRREARTSKESSAMAEEQQRAEEVLRKIEAGNLP
ncbi:MAG: hypothetical protein Q7R81_06035 [Candidatus Peregrinibacteria bacterium]|nr:hypothetical protein [Candidatus Peregrinibacteria bacterium]